MRNVTRYAAALLLASVTATAPAQSPHLSELISNLPESARSRLLEEGNVERYLEDHSEVALLPEHPFADDIVELMRGTEPNVISEQVVLARGSVTNGDALQLFNSLRRVSELAYLEYYNERRGSSHDLFKESTAVRGPEDRTAVADPTVDSIPDRDTVWVLQGLPPFGTILSEYQYRSMADSFLFFGTNHETLVYRGVPIVRPGNMLTFILVIPGDEFVLMYGLGGVRAFKMFGLLDNRIEAAFSGRTDGLFDWYSGQYLSEIAD